MNVVAAVVLLSAWWNKL